MSTSQRIRSFMSGLFMIPLAAVLATSPDAGYLLIMAALSIGLVARGLHSLIYYFTMARFSVGGKISLYLGITILDLGFFTFSIADIPKLYILLYLLGIHMFSGLVEIWAAVSEKRLGAVSWRLKFSRGLINVIIGILCLVFIRSKDTAVYIYCAGMAYNGLMRMVTAFRKTAMVYIQ